MTVTLALLCGAALADEYDYEAARSMLAYINEFRTGEDAWYWEADNTTKTYVTGLSPLKYDYDLEAVAMLRASEIAVKFSHTRPDGSKWSTAFPVEITTGGRTSPAVSARRTGLSMDSGKIMKGMTARDTGETCCGRNTPGWASAR